MLILASKSQTRKTLLEQAGLAVKTVPASLDERAQEQATIAAGGDGRDVARRLAESKAMAVSASHPGRMVLGADQTLSLGTELFHKPETMQEAAAQLDRLRGKTHRLHAAAALIRDGVVLWSGLQTAELTMHEFSTEERDRVLQLEGEAVLGSVGAYRLEGPSARLFESVNGDYFAILGLPLLPVLSALRTLAPELLQ
ncbi:Maf family protein [Devosia albogilva]|uniref:Nucleoside triphosphate pyrophosphatase n=1 Tax=Devosia albogilva TaxID=429726 RepID=A0ABW5QJK2_9HYPH